MRSSWCTHCATWKPLDAFSPKTRHPDGSYATVLSRCKACLAELRRLRRREDPEWARREDRRNWERLQADPVKAAARRELQRENSAAFRAKQKERPLSESELRDRAQKELWRLERAERRAA